MNDRKKVETLLFKHDYRLARVANPTVWKNARHDTLTFNVSASEWRSWSKLLAHFKKQIASSKGLKKIKFTLPDLTKSRSVPVFGIKKSTVTVFAPVKTKGTGIYYEEKKPEVELSPEQAAIKEARRKEKRARRAAIKEQVRNRDSIVSSMVDLAQTLLNQWRTMANDYDHRARTFPGWTADFYCPLPVDQEMSTRYQREFERERQYMERSGLGPLSLSDMDKIVDVGIKSAERDTDLVVADVLKTVRSLSRSSIANSALLIPTFLERLRQKQQTANSQRDVWAIGYVGENIQEIFESTTLEEHSSVQSDNQSLRKSA